MSQLTVSCTPSENEESISVTDRSASLSPGNKNTSGTQRNRTATHNQPHRSSTHGDATSNSTEEAGSSNKLQNNAARRTVAKPAANPTAFKRPTSGTAAGSNKLEMQYSLKKKRYVQYKKDLVDKQKHAQELYNEMSQLREKLISAGARDPGRLEDLKVEVGSPKQLLPSEAVAIISDQVDSKSEKFVANNEFIESLSSQMQEIPKKSQNLCRELLDKQSDFVAFVTSFLIHTSEADTEAVNANAELTIQLEAHQKNCDDLRSQLAEIVESEANSVVQLTNTVREMVDEYESYRKNIKELKLTENRKELETQLNVTAEELETERQKGNQSKERLREMESKLQKSRAKIRDLEAHIANDEVRIQQLQTNLKNLEAQMKQKDQSMELKLKEMQKTVKNNKGLVDKVEKQRDSLETRLLELKDKMNSKENDAMNTIKELSEKLNTVTEEVGMEKEKRQQVEEAMNELEERYKSLEEKSQQLCELAEKNKDFTITEGNHTANEVQLFKDLQEARKELETQREMIDQLQKEKEDIVAVMHQAAIHDDEEDTREKLAVELVFKTNELQHLRMQHADLKKVAKNAQERNGLLEKQLAEIQNRLHAQSKEGGKAGLSAHAIELQQQVSDLHNTLVDVIRQKKELETVLTQKQLELEQRDRVMREQSKVLKVRDELLDILKGKTQQANGEVSNSEENNEYIDQITAKTEVIQELYATLENKQRQIMRLEKMVKLMEEQQDLAQAQRTRFENRIAQLELTLQKNKEQRSKGFGIL